MEKYEDYLDKWLGGLESEIAFWKRYMETEGDIYYDTFKEHTRKNKNFTLEKHLSGMEEKRMIKFIDVGSGPFSRCGCISDKYNLLVDAVDPLAEIYNILKEKNDLDNGIKIKTGFVELLDKIYEPESYDIVHMSNSLDHSFDAVFGIYQLLNLCKIGGKVILRHAENEAERSEYGGLHQWNLSVHNEEDSFVIWRHGERYDIKKMLDGYADVEWNSDLYENRWKYNEIVITKIKSCPIPENNYADKILERVYSFLLKQLLDKISLKNNNQVIRNQHIMKEIRESDRFDENIKKIEKERNIDIYGMGVVGKLIIDRMNDIGIKPKYIYDREERNYKQYKSIQLGKQKDVENNVVIIAVMREQHSIKGLLINNGYIDDNIYLADDLV